MDLMFGLATVDRMQGETEARRLYQGWAGRESATGRKVCRAVAATLVTLATRLAPVEEQSAGAPPSLAGTTHA